MTGETPCLRRTSVPYTNKVSVSRLVFAPPRVVTKNLLFSSLLESSSGCSCRVFLESLKGPNPFRTTLLVEPTPFDSYPFLTRHIGRQNSRMSSILRVTPSWTFHTERKTSCLSVRCDVSSYVGPKSSLRGRTNDTTDPTRGRRRPDDEGVEVFLSLLVLKLRCL